MAGNRRGDVAHDDRAPVPVEPSTTEKPVDTSAGGQNAGDRLPPADEDQVRELARAMSVAALERLEQIVLHGAESAAVQAAGVILDRAWGRPHQTVVNVRSGVVVLPEEEIDELRAIES